MRKIFTSTLVFCSVIYLSSCKKDSSDTPINNNLIGNYTFVSMTANTESTVILNDGSTIDKTVTKSNYTTINNTGTLVIDANNITSTGLSYSVDTTAMAVFYEDGELIDSLEIPFTATVPTGSATSEYKLISSDSLYFPKGSIFVQGNFSQSKPVGSKFRLEGNKLYFTGSQEQVVQNSQAGVSMTTTDKASIVAIYQKQ